MLAAAATTTLGALPVFLLSAQSVLVRQDLHFDERALGLAVSTFFAAAAVGALVSGRFFDSVSRRTRRLLAAALSITSAVVVAVAPAYGILLVGMLLCGLANAALQTEANLHLARAVRRSRQGIAFGVKQSAAPGAVLLGGLAVPTVGLMVGWRWTYAVVAAGALVLVVRGAWGGPSGEAESRPSGRDGPAGRALLVTGLAMTLASGAVTAMAAFVPLWAHEVGMGPGRAGVLVAVGSALSITARIVGGHRADRRGGRNLPVVATGMAIGAGGMALLSVHSTTTLILGTLTGFFLGWSWPGLLLFALVRLGRDRPGAATSAVQAGAFLGGAMGPLLFGVVVHATSYRTAWWVAALSMLLASASIMMARRLFLADLRRRPDPARSGPVS